MPIILHPCWLPNKRVTEEEVAARVDGICRGLGVDLPPGSILYRPMYRALADEAPRLRADFARHGVHFVILDSFGAAAGAEPESADSTIRVMNALRSFTDTTKLVLAHVSKAAADQPTGAARPYGSVFVRNLARSAWELRRAEETESDELLVAAYHRKHNAGRRALAFGLRLRFEPDGAVVVTGADLAEARAQDNEPHRALTRRPNGVSDPSVTLRAHGSGARNGAGPKGASNQEEESDATLPQ